MSKPPVLHIYDPNGKIDGFAIRNLLSVPRDPVTVHIDRGSDVDTFTVTADGVTPTWVTQPGKCGCP